MDAAEIYHLLFETYAGIGILVGAGILLSLIACVIFEIRTRKLYHNHEPVEDEDEWSFFEDEVEEGEEEEEEKLAKKKADKDKKGSAKK